LIPDPWFWALAIPAVALTGISKGGLGGGAAVATPLMALTIPPAQAAAVMLPVLCLMDIAGVRAYLGRWDREYSPSSFRPRWSARSSAPLRSAT
jgi:uncharacterized protein